MSNKAWLLYSKDIIKRRNSKLLESKAAEETKEDPVVEEKEEKHMEGKHMERKHMERKEQKEKEPVRKESGILRKSSLVANEDLRAEFQNTVKKRVSFSNWSSEISFNDSISSLSSFQSTNEPARRDSLTSEPKRRNSVPSRASSSSSVMSSVGSEPSEQERSEKVGNKRQYGIRLKGRSHNSETSSNKDALTVEETVGGSGFNLIAVFDGYVAVYAASLFIDIVSLF